MKTWGKWIVGALVVALVSVLGLGISPVNAQDSDEEPVRPRVQAAEIVIGAVAEVTGLSEDDIRDQVRDGNSLLEILEAEGVDSEAVIDDITGQLTAEIESALEDGLITQRRADRLLERLPVMIERALEFCTLDHPVMGRMMERFGEHRGFFGMDDEWDGFFGMRGEHHGLGGRMGGGLMGRGSHRWG